MNRVPHAAVARAEGRKVRDYLLNPGNARNQGKSRQFGQYGFTRQRWELLAEALCTHASNNPVIRIVPSRHGVKYVVECNLATPDRRNPCMRSVWIVEPGEEFPRLVTAY